MDAGLAALVVGATVCYVAVASALGQVVVKLSGSSSGGGFFVQETVAMVVVSYLLVTVIVGTTVEVLRSAFKAVFVCFVQVVKELLLLAAGWWLLSSESTPFRPVGERELRFVVAGFSARREICKTAVDNRINFPAMFAAAAAAARSACRGRVILRCRSGCFVCALSSSRQKLLCFFPIPLPPFKNLLPSCIAFVVLFPSARSLVLINVTHYLGRDYSSGCYFTPRVWYAPSENFIPKFLFPKMRHLLQYHFSTKQNFAKNSFTV